MAPANNARAVSDSAHMKGAPKLDKALCLVLMSCLHSNKRQPAAKPPSMSKDATQTSKVQYRGQAMPFAKILLELCYSSFITRASVILESIPLKHEFRVCRLHIEPVQDCGTQCNACKDSEQRGGQRQRLALHIHGLVTDIATEHARKLQAAVGMHMSTPEHKQDHITNLASYDHLHRVVQPAVCNATCALGPNGPES